MTLLLEKYAFLFLFEGYDQFFESFLCNLIVSIAIELFYMKIINLLNHSPDRHIVLELFGIGLSLL